MKKEDVFEAVANRSIEIDLSFTTLDEARLLLVNWIGDNVRMYIV